jgi:AcrR family transcriptional regulator
VVIVNEMGRALSGRRAQAARNDDAILQAAREVFLADPSAPVAAVAKRAGVGISAVYRRFESKEELLRRLCADGQRIYIAECERALADDGDPWAAYLGFLERIVARDTHSLSTRLAGTFTPTAQHLADADRMHRLGERLFLRTRQAGALREGLTFLDVGLLLELVANARLGDAERTAAIRQRFLAVLVDGIRAKPRGSQQRLPGRPPSREEQEARWVPA